MSVTPLVGPCFPWARLVDVENCGCSGADAYLASQFIQVASEILFNLSGRQFSGGYDEEDELAGCSETIRPCASRVTARNMPAWNFETVWTMNAGEWNGGSYFPWGWYPSGGACGCDQALARCGCGGLSQIALPNFPVTSIEQVKVDGDVLVSGTDYAVDDFYWLVRLGTDSAGNYKTWPCCQDLHLADTEDDTWSVTYTWGQAPPMSGVRAAADLACNLLNACQGNQCQLPQRVSQVVREGITYLVATDIEAMLAAGHVGITSVDTFLESVNPHSIRQQPTVYSPDLGPGSVRRTWP